MGAARVVTLRQRAIDDMLGFIPNEHDVRIARGDHIYWVRAVRRGSGLMTDVGPTVDSVVALLVLVPIAAICSLIQRRLRWKVGIVRVPSPGSWTAARGTVLLRKELLVAGTAPEPRIAELADEVRSGRFDPSTGPVA